MKISKIKIIATVSILFFLFAPNSVFAKEYYYRNVDVDITINKNSTFDVTEKQTYLLNDNFGFFNRDLSTNKTDAITDVQVFDENNNAVPKSELDIKSTIGARHIQWNFPRRDFSNEEKGWIVKYKVHGGISFLKNFDEIYWNAVPSEREAVIKNVAVKIRLGSGEKFDSNLIWLYSENIPNPINGLPTENLNTNNEFSYEKSLGGYFFNNDNKEANFWGKNLQPNTNFTVAAGFPKGIVDQGAYWRDFLNIYYGYILSILIILASIIFGLLWWYKAEKSREGKRAIIPEYEPPENLRPAMAEVIVKEKLTDKGLSATIIDLAVRGYVKIEEEEKSALYKFFSNTHVITAIISVISIILILLVGIEVIIVAFALIFLIMLISKSTIQKNYIVRKIKDYQDDPGLEQYERQYLNAIFDAKDYFSTKEIKQHPSESQELYKRMLKVKDRVYKETETDTKAFEIGLTAEKTRNIIWGTLVFVIVFVFLIFGDFIGTIGQFVFPIFTLIVSSIGLYAFIKYDARLSDEGMKLKENWLGFKMYLETAERYRMQNLKPEYFEKYLPYAIIFEVEKKWAKAFETMNLPQPSWYGSSAFAAGTVSPSSVSSFSPSAFSASFASSFSSVISSSGASGASGGGGGAGGGGGGGGGGAG